MFVVRRAAVLLLTPVTLACVAAFAWIGDAGAARSQTHVVILIDVSGSMVDNFDWPSDTSQVNAAKWRLILAKPEYLARIAKGRELVDRPSSATSDLGPDDARTRRRLIEGLEGRRGPNPDREIARILAEDALSEWKVPVKDSERKALIDEVVRFWEDAPFATARDRIRFNRMKSRLDAAVRDVMAVDGGQKVGDTAKANRLLGAARREAAAREFKWAQLPAGRKTEIARFVAMREELVADRATSFLDQFVEAASPGESTIEAFAFSTPQQTRRPTYRAIEALDFSRVSFTSGDTNLSDALREGREVLARLAKKAGNLGRDLLVIWVLTDGMHDLYDSPEDREKRQYQAFARDLLKQPDLVEPVHFPIHLPAIEGSTAAERAKNYSGLYSMLVLPLASLAEREQLVADYRDLLKRLEAKTGAPAVPLKADPSAVTQALTLKIAGIKSTPAPLRSNQKGTAVVDVELVNASSDFDFSNVQLKVDAKIARGTASPQVVSEQRSVDRVPAGRTTRLAVPFVLDDPVAPLTVEVTAKARHGTPIVGRYNVPWFPNPETIGAIERTASLTQSFQVTHSFGNPPPFIWVIVGVAAVAAALLFVLIRGLRSAKLQSRPSVSR